MNIFDPNRREVGNAADRKRRAILSEILDNSSIQFYKESSPKVGQHGLNINCGESNLSFMLTEQLGEAGKLTATDIDPVNLKIAEQKAQIENIVNVEFYSVNAFDKWALQTYHFIFGRLLLSQISDRFQVVQQMHSLLAPEGMLIIEELDLEDYNCFPYSYAFERFKELLNKLSLKKGYEATKGAALNNLLKGAGFKDITIQLVPPIFLKGKGKQLPSLTFESQMKAIVEEKIASSAEVNAILTELRNFEQTEDTLISLPSLYQARAYKL